MHIYGRLRTVVTIKMYLSKYYFNVEDRRRTSLNSATCFWVNIEKTLEPVRLALRLPRDDCLSLPPPDAGAAGAGAAGASSAGASSFAFFFFTFLSLSACKNKKNQFRCSYLFRNVVEIQIHLFIFIYSHVESVTNCIRVSRTFVKNP